jgi:hypothetical protein
MFFLFFYFNPTINWNLFPNAGDLGPGGENRQM